MWKNHLNILVRNIRNHKLHSAINILGLAIGIACCILTMLYIQAELGYDQNHQKADRIYRVIRETTMAGQTTFGEGTSGGLAEVLKNEYPEVEQSVRMVHQSVWAGYGQKHFKQKFCLAGKNILNVFDFPLLKGDASTVFLEPQAVLITQAVAQKLFGSEDPIGKTITVEGGFVSYDYHVAGILQNLPDKTTLNFDILSTTVEVTWPEVWVNWAPAGYRHVQNYILLNEGVNPQQFTAKISDIIQRYMGEDIAKNNRYHLQPLNRVYLYSNLDYGIQKPSYGDIQNIYLLLVIAGATLIIACVNFVNLTTARATRRAREVGLRKVVGAHKHQLIAQFLSESIILSFGALILALGLASLALPAFNAFIERDLTLSLNNAHLLLSLIGLTLCVGILAGCYPAFVLSAFQPVSVLKGHTQLSVSTTLRKSLVLGQFAITILLLTGTWTVYQQLRFLKNKSLGFDREQIITVPIFRAGNGTPYGWNLKEGYNRVKDAFLRHPNVLAATVSRFDIGEFAVRMGFQTADGNPWSMYVIGIDEDFIDFYDIEWVSGTNFTRRYAETTNFERRDQNLQEPFIINETAAKQLGWTDPIGKPLTWNVGGNFFPNGQRHGTIIGVVKDFHFQSLHNKIQPLVFIAEFKNLKHLYLKIIPQNFSETRAFLEATWQKHLPTRPFAFSFLDDNLAHLYQTETKLSQILGIFAILGIFIACMGLFALATLSAEQRAKEIGIRKVLGASVSNLFGLVVKDFVKLVLVANIIMFPIAYYATQQWLQNFAYRIDLTITPFLLVSLTTLLIALTTVSYQSLKAALTNPVDVLRHE